MSTVSSITTAEQLFAESDRLGRCELVRGELHDMAPPGGEHGSIAMELGAELTMFVRRHKLGRVYADVGFILERHPDTVRAPDIAFIATARLEPARTPKYIPIPPDFIVEVVSPSDLAAEIVGKIQWWLEHGVKLAWVVDPGTRTCTAYWPDGKAQVHRAADIASADPVIPGFTIRIGSLFE